VNLDDLIQEGIKDSSGTFTIAKEKALEKMAAFRLISESAWILKVIQAAVVSNCSEIDVRQTSTATEFHLTGSTGWTLQQVEDEFHQPESSPLDHLKHGLWSVCLNGMRPFSLTLPQSPEMLFWNGQAMLRKRVKPGHKTVLSVSHRTIHEGRGIPLLSNIEAATRNAELARELTQHAFACPKPLRLDRRRLDALQLCPRHGLSSTSYPVQMGFLKGEIPEFKLPQATISGFTQPKEVDPKMRKILKNQATLPSRLALVCLVTAHLRKVAQEKTMVWEAYTEESLIYWVRDGVVVERTRPKVGSSGCCSLAVFASAEGLDSDAGGFTLRKNDEFSTRERQVCRLGANFLREVDLSMDAIVHSARRNSRIFGGLIALGGIGAAFWAPAHGIGITLMGAYTFFTAGSNETEVARQTEAGLHGLRRDWTSRYS
jgi:hypothetical protein